jgi:hypothetical protein
VNVNLCIYDEIASVVGKRNLIEVVSGSNFTSNNRVVGTCARRYKVVEVVETEEAEHGVHGVFPRFFMDVQIS